MASVYKYYSGLSGVQGRSTVEIINSNDICVVDIAIYINGVETFPCGSGNDKKLSYIDKTNINKIISKQSGIEGLTGYKARKLRAKLERTVKSKLNSFYDWKECFRWACSELGINNELIQMLYPTTLEFLSITDFKHIND